MFSAKPSSAVAGLSSSTLSKRTSVWAGYVKINNDAQAAYNFGVNNYNIAIGGKPQGLAFGAWHNF